MRDLGALYSKDTHDDSTGEYTDDEEEEYELVNGEDLVGYESEDDSSDEENHEDGYDYEEEDFILVEDDWRRDFYVMILNQ